jgi:hypothetical protein
MSSKHYIPKQDAAFNLLQNAVCRMKKNASVTGKIPGIRIIFVHSSRFFHKKMS